MYCGKCGSSIPEGAGFCGQCGCPVAGASNPSAQQATPTPQPNPAASTPPVNQAPTTPPYNQATTASYSQPTNSANYQVPNAPVSTPVHYAADGSPIAVPPPISTNRNLIAYFFLGIITCGIYWYYYVYKLAQDINRMCAADGDKIGGLAAYILLSFVTCGIYQYYWQYKIANRLQANAPRYGLTFSENGLTVFLWDIIGMWVCFLGPLVGMYIIMKNTNAMAAVYNSRIVAPC